MASSEPVTYKVTRVTPDTQFPAGEPPVPGKQVAFATSAGYSGAVFVPDAVFADLAAMKRMIEDQVMLVVRAQMISGTVQAS